MTEYKCKFKTLISTKSEVVDTLLTAITHFMV